MWTFEAVDALKQCNKGNIFACNRNDCIEDSCLDFGTCILFLKIWTRQDKDEFSLILEAELFKYNSEKGSIHQM